MSGSGADDASPRYARPVPSVGDASSAAERRADPAGWAMGADVVAALDQVVGGRRDIRRYRPDPVPEELLRQVLEAGHAAPSVGHSQPWRFVVVTDPLTRDRAAAMADRCRLDQAHLLTDDRAARMLDLKLEGLREAPVGVVVACDRRTPASGVLGRATFHDADLWSCAAAVENMWLAARARGLGMGWVTLFEPAALADLLGLPEGVETLGWMCLGWPDERPPEPGLQRAAWSRKVPLDEVIVRERWSEGAGPAPARSYLAAPSADQLVSATDAADELLSPPESLGVLDRAISRVVACAGDAVAGGTLVLAAADQPVTAHGVSAYPASTTRDILAASLAGTSLGATTASAGGLGVVVVDAGVDDGTDGEVDTDADDPVEVIHAGEGGAHHLDREVSSLRDARPRDARGDLVGADAMTRADVDRLLARGREIGAGAASDGLVCLGEAGVGNTTTAAALACALLGLEPQDAVGLGAGSDAEIVARKREVVAAALARTAGQRGPGHGGAQSAETAGEDALQALAAVGGPEMAVLTGVVLGAVEQGAAVVLDGLAGSLPALVAARIEPGVQAHLVAGHVSRERAHALVLRELGLEPLLALRLRAGEGVGACLAASMLLQGLAARRATARTR
ncbi:hypothetical protein GCM10027055_13670 [Janibacter alkaliphilus]|uniref:Nicotinate-nucleotide--dimethylbenzimidazole phosphoribosyltransferase n=1 Tax=Janibacter alkaliphilus TaxID=1069963 RepID=A0A852X2R3_9MICO|nr:nicotinate-nucleotide--dimethylbenzimidazole phosphoribosyltransferase [Janibacter alkaliphilus]